MLSLVSNEYVGLPPELQRVGLPPELQRIHGRVNRVEDDLEKETIERKENNKIMYDKFDRMNNMIIYQLGAAILTLVMVIAMFIIK